MSENAPKKNNFTNMYTSTYIFPVTNKLVGMFSLTHCESIIIHLERYLTIQISTQAKSVDKL